jgi:hypothetical protein
MQSTGFAFPVKEGMVERGMRFIEELGTDRAEHHHHVHKAHGFTTARMWYQTQPFEAVIIYLEADDIEAALGNLRDSKHDFDSWFFSQIKELSGVHATDFQTLPLLDWHHQDGHRHVIKAPKE